LPPAVATMMEDDVMDRKNLREGDEVWVVNTGYYSGQPYAHVTSGTVVVVGDDGGFVYRTADGRVDNKPAWMIGLVVATEAEAWLAAASDLASLAARVADKAAECRAKATVEVVA
jgi:hypothetical protein